MNPLESKLQILNPSFLQLFKDSTEEVTLLLGKYDSNFSSYTDHSSKHTLEVYNLAANLLSDSEIDNLNADEIYILSMACLLHDVGMCIPENKLIELFESKTYEHYRFLNPKKSVQDSLRDVHHELSYDFILQEWISLKIPNENYAMAIALVAKGHRKVELDNIEVYTPKYFVKNGRDFVCLPYLASIIRIADELDITNIRTPKLLNKYYLPENKISIREWNKHISTTQINFDSDKVIYKVKCSDQNNLAALEEQFEKIQDVIHYCQKIIRNISNTNDRKYSLELTTVKVDYKYIDFNPKGIRFSFNVANVVNTFIGHNLYKNELTAVREVIQNAIDSCRYKKSIHKNDYSPKINVLIEESKIIISDNGLGMDEFIIQNFFGKLGSSFYKDEIFSDEFEAIGQFGVGVFSYFLLCDYIDIETKTKDSKPLKFRIDKDHKSYFHFYPNSQKLNSGTEITFNLKDNIIETYLLSDYLDYIMETFRYIEFPLEIKSKEFYSNLSMRKFNCHGKAEIRRRIKIIHRNETKKFTTISHYISNEEYEGECSVIIPIVSLLPSLENLCNHFDYESFSHNGISEINISQKGVFVNTFSLNLLNYSFGDINIKKNAKININRNEFADKEYITNIMSEFSIELIKKILIHINDNFEDELRVQICNDFIDDYMPNVEFNFIKELDLISLRDLISLKVIDGHKTKYLTVNQLINNYDNFVIISSGEFNSELHNKFDCPIVLLKGLGIYQGPFKVFKTMCPHLTKYSPSILNIGDKCYLKYSKNRNYQQYLNTKNSLIDVTDYEVDECMEFDNHFIIANPYINKTMHDLYEFNFGIIININHPFVKFSLDQIKNNPKITKKLKQTFSIITDIIRTKSEEKRIVNIGLLNDMVSIFNESTPIYTFTENDFQKNIELGF